MKMMRISPALGLAALLLVAFSSCKNERNTWDGEVTSTVDQNFADSEFNSIRNMVDTEGTADSAIYGKTTGTTGIFCPTSVTTVTVTGSNTARLTIDFGTGSNCLDGRLRTGKLHADFSGKWKDSGSTVVITPEGYTVGGYAFSFNASVTVNGRDANNDLSWTTVVTDAVLTHPTAGTIDWSGTRTTTWVEGEGSGDPNTYVYEVTGNSSGVARSGRGFQAQIVTPLRIELSCRYITAGTLSISPQDLETRTLDYGTTGCDDQAELTVGKFWTQLTLP
ncbi:MAG: hypothetical protein U0176_25440 [Bacteroidia bacterium]